jgi:hypothetical protein
MESIRSSPNGKARPLVIVQRPATFVGTLFEMAAGCSESVIGSENVLLLRGTVHIMVF